MVIESPHFLHLLKDLEYDTIYHEHLSYILVKPLVSFLRKYNFEIFDVIKKDIHGGSIRIFISQINNYEITKNVKNICTDEISTNLYCNKSLIQFSKKVEINRYNLISFLTKLKKQKKKNYSCKCPCKRHDFVKLF